MTEAWPEAPCTLAQLQSWLHSQSGLPALEVRMLLMQALQFSRTELMTRDHTTLEAPQLAQVRSLIQRRCAGEPMAYISGEREFFGLPLQVNPAVLIPRPDTELLVELAAQHAPNGGAVLDMGAGSGAIVLALAHLRPDLQLCALDASSAALEVARANAARLQQAGLLQNAPQFLLSDWFSALPAHMRFALIVSNPPYIAADDKHLQQGDLRFEPAQALTDGADGLQDLRHIITHSPAWLEEGGWLLLEHGHQQAAAVRALLQAHGFVQAQSWRDLAGIERVSGACRAASR
ncbi:peptide chain release factor N(5)-glutamine methyltransferase [Massilia sp. W12]|uniref:peptide chain release factor N(5)-glutamine methyltransferase n=1 Tax=Massilia sp. W12 TaxID=3126507 RepID=UPI0030CDFE0F